MRNLLWESEVRGLCQCRQVQEVRASSLGLLSGWNLGRLRKRTLLRSKQIRYWCRVEYGVDFVLVVPSLISAFLATLRNVYIL